MTPFATASIWSLIRTQILSYYKWLRKHALYLPRELQEKIYRYFPMKDFQ